mgnify:CR=1 FL=1
MPSDRRWEGPAGPPQHKRIQEAILALAGLMHVHQETLHLPFFKRRKPRKSLREADIAMDMFFESVRDLYTEWNHDKPWSSIKASPFVRGYSDEGVLEPYEALWLPLVRRYDLWRTRTDDYLWLVGMTDNSTARRLQEAVKEALEEIAAHNDWSLVLPNSDNEKH